MLKAEQVPDAAVQAAHDVFWNAVYDGKPIDLEIEFDRLFHYAIAAAINVWPEMTAIPATPDGQWTHNATSRAHIVLPFTENTID